MGKNYQQSFAQVAVSLFCLTSCESNHENSSAIYGTKRRAIGASPHHFPTRGARNMAHLRWGGADRDHQRGMGERSIAPFDRPNTKPNFQRAAIAARRTVARLAHPHALAGVPPAPKGLRGPPLAASKSAPPASHLRQRTLPFHDGYHTVHLFKMQ